MSEKFEIAVDERDQGALYFACTDDQFDGQLCAAVARKHLRQTGLVYWRARFFKVGKVPKASAGFATREAAMEYVRHALDGLL